MKDFSIKIISFILLMLFILIIFGFIYCLYKIYFNNLLFFLDLIASIGNFFNYYLIQYRYKVVEYNLKKVFQNISSAKINYIYYNSTKLFFLNMLIAFHQRFIIDTNYLIKFYNKFELSEQLKEDLNKNKVIFAMSHYGIYYDFTSYYYFISNLVSDNNNIMAPVYKMSNQTIENMVYDCPKFKNKILPIKHDKLGSLINNDYKSIYLVTDQKARANKEKINFLRNLLDFHYSVADIHKATKRCIWYFSSYYDFKNKKLNIEVIPIKNLNKKKDIVQKIADLITERALKYPEQYFWHHDRFNSGLK